MKTVINVRGQKMDPQADLEYWKTRFIAYWSQSGRNSFPLELKKQFLHEIKDSVPSSGIKINMASDSDAAKEILEQIIPFDPALKRFQEYVKLYENFSPKAFQFLQIPELPATAQSSLKGIAEKENWRLSEAGSWACRKISQKNNRTRITVAKESKKILTANLIPSKVPDSVYDSILDMAKESIPGAERLQLVKVAVVAPNVFQFTVDFDWNTNTVEIESDIKDWIDETTTVDLRAVRLEALAAIAKETGIKFTAELNSLITKPTPIDAKLHAKVEKIHSKDSLVIIKGGKFHVDGKDGANDEDLAARLSKFALHQLDQDIKAFFRENKKLDGFLNTHQTYNRDKTEYQAKLKTNNQEACHGYFIKVFPKQLTKEDQSKSPVPDAFAVEIVTFEYDNVTGDWDIRTQDYSRRVRDAFISELHNLSRKPAKPKAPPVGKHS